MVEGSKAELARLRVTSPDGPLYRIAYRSRLGDEFRNWAIFETPDGAGVWTGESETLAIEADDADLRRALELHGVRLVASH